jgi:NADPH:quinone reductase-like Zn-dependent oxidoreductase
MPRDLRDLLHRCDSFSRHSGFVTGLCFSSFVFAFVSAPVRAGLKFVGELHDTGIFPDIVICSVNIDIFVESAAGPADGFRPDKLKADVSGQRSEIRKMKRIRSRHLYRMRRLQFLWTALVCACSVVSRAQSSAPMMKAIVAHKYGGPEVLKLEEIPRPEPKEDEILVRVIAAGVNPVDSAARSQKFGQFLHIKLPAIPGYDVAGIVEKAGAKITKFKPGDPVYAYIALDKGGGYAQYAVATEKEAAAKPQSLTYVEAAAVPLVAETAWQALIDAAKLSAGQSVLIHGGSGGVGTFAIQIAKARGAKVIATASTANQDLLKQLGADVAIDYTKQKFEDVAKDVDVVLDSVGKDTLARSYGVVKKGGFIVSIVGRPDPAELEKHGIRGASISVEPNSSELAEIGRLIDEKKIKVIVSQTLPIAEAAKAQEQIATHHTRGKIVLKVADEPK